MKLQSLHGDPLFLGYNRRNDRPGRTIRAGRFGTLVFLLCDGLLPVGCRDQEDVAAADTTLWHHLWTGLKLNSRVKTYNREIMTCELYRALRNHLLQHLSLIILHL